MSQEEIKNRILERIKNGKPAAVPLPDVPMFLYEKNAEEDFISHLIGFDGRAIKFKTRDDAVKWLLEQPEMDAAKYRIYSSAEGVPGNFGEKELAQLREAEKIQVCVTEGLLGVGEMGAIWVTDETLQYAAAALLSRRLFIFLDYAKLVGSMHEAYANIKVDAQQYGSFFTGPSATADIEAVHITGAQGPLAMTALIYNSPTAPDTPELMVNPNADFSKWVQYE